MDFFIEPTSEAGQKRKPGDQQPDSAAAKRPLSVFELTQRLKRAFETQFSDVYIEGEISNLRPAASGHVYFVLKDKQATISCVLWSREAAALERMPREGETVEIRGSVTIYEARGQYQVIVRTLRPAGLGKLFLAFQELKQRLEAEGLFDQARKRPVPRFPKRIGIVTSPTGAAVRDILNVLKRRAMSLNILIWPARVQGDGAAQQIAYGIARMNALRCCDVLIVGRGGGSLEDLWSFNEEIVARAIYQSAIPVISAVGHEIDFTIADFVADLRAPTPSAAAELVCTETAGAIRALDHLHTRLGSAVRHKYEFLRHASHLSVRMQGTLLPRLREMRSQVRGFEKCHALRRPIQKLHDMKQRLDEAMPRAERITLQRAAESQRRLERLNAQLRALDPRAVLGRGYSITCDARSRHILRSSEEARPGQALNIILSSGNIDAIVGGPVVEKPRRERRARPSFAADEWFGLGTGEEEADTQP